MHNHHPPSILTLRRGVALLILASLLGLLALGLPVHARPAPRSSNPQQQDTALLAQLQRAAGNPLRIGYHARTARLRFVGTSPDRPLALAARRAGAASAEQTARAFLHTYGALFGVADQATDLRLVSSQPVVRGRSYVRFQQRYRGVPVLGGELIIQTGPANTVVSASGEVVPDIDLDMQPTIPADVARQAAATAVLRHALTAAPLSSSTPELWIYDERILGGRGLQRPVVVWRIEVSSERDPLLRKLVLIDAQLGALTQLFNLAPAVRDRRICDGQDRRDVDSNATDNCDGSPPSEYVRSEGGPPSPIADINQAYDFSGDAYTFYFTRFGRDSVDGLGLPLRSIVRYCGFYGGCPYANAAWNGEVMLYGAGYAAADDVVGHELSHGVTQFTSRLYYYYQSGAINESLSDIFGEFVDLTNGRGTDTPAVRWQLGEDLPPATGVVRDMSDPPAFNDPDRMSSPYYTADVLELDDGGVHTNSGVNNKAAVLLTDGGTFNGRTVYGLGIDKVAQLYYEVNTYLLTSAADYQDLAGALDQACQNLLGTAGITTADCTQVTAAVAATEMTLEPPAAAAAEAPVCEQGLSGAAFWSDDFETPSAGRWASQTLAGSNVWYYPPSDNDLSFNATYATSGEMNLWGHDRAGVTDSVIAMDASVVLPAGAWMRFNHAYGFDDDGPYGSFDGGIVEYSTTDGDTWLDAGALIADNGYTGTITGGYDNPLSNRAAFVGESNGYYSSRLNLQSLAGQKVRFRFRIGTSRSYADYGWFIDDVQLYTCGAAVSATPTPTRRPTISPPASPAATPAPIATAVASPTPIATAVASPTPGRSLQRVFVPNAAR